MRSYAPFILTILRTLKPVENKGLTLNLLVEQNGAQYDVPLSLACNNPKCKGEYSLITTFSNFQELWQCEKCKDKYFVWTAEATYEKTVVEKSATERVYDAEYHSEAVEKNCEWCRKPFVTFDPQEDLCEGCNFASRVGYKN